MYLSSLPIKPALTALSPTFVKSVPDGSETGYVLLISPALPCSCSPIALFWPLIWAALICTSILKLSITPAAWRIQSRVRGNLARQQDFLAPPAEIQGFRDIKGGRGHHTFWCARLTFSAVTCHESLEDYLADSVDTFLTDSGSPSSAIPPSLAPNGSHDAILEDNSDSSYIPLALTFSFPVEQTALDSGTLLTWTKGFSAKNAIGKDIVKLLQDAFDRRHIHVRCVALVNDVSIRYSAFSGSESCSVLIRALDCWCPPITGVHVRRMHPWCHFWYRDERRVRGGGIQYHKAWKCASGHRGWLYDR